LSIFIIYIDYIKLININGLAIVYPDEIKYYNSLVSEFNKYSKKNDLNINLILTILTSDNSTLGIDDFGSLMDTLINKKSKKYDLYFYYGIYSKRYGQHFLVLDDYFSKDYLKKYDREIITKACTYKNKIIGLVIIDNKN